jgi:hypothetical protein
MKKIYFSFFVLVAMLAGTSCKKDAHISVPTEDSIIGTWDWVKTDEQNIPDIGVSSTITTVQPHGAYWNFKGFGVLQFATTNINQNTAWMLLDNSTLQITLQTPTSATITLLNDHYFVFNYVIKYNGGKILVTQYLSR